MHHNTTPIRTVQIHSAHSCVNKLAVLCNEYFSLEMGWLDFNRRECYFKKETHLRALIGDGTVDIGELEGELISELVELLKKPVYCTIIVCCIKSECPFSGHS